MSPIGRLIVSRVLLAAFAAVLAFTTASCRRSAIESPTDAEPLAGWLVLESGRFRLAGGPPAQAHGETSGDAEVSGRSSYLPWTVQSRVSDLCARDGVLYVAVNGFGMASVPLPYKPGDAFTSDFAPGIFGGRTVTEIYADQDGLILHVYVNRTLASPEANPAGLGLAFLAYRASRTTGGSATYESVSAPFQSAHPDWEAVAVVRTSPADYAVEWKRTDDERTEFAYTTFAPRRGTETTIDRTRFRNAYAVLPGAAGDADVPLRSLFHAVLQQVQMSLPSAAGTAVHLVVRSDGAAARRYAYQPEGYLDRQDVDVAVVPGRRSAGFLWALTPDGTLFGIASRGDEVTYQQLPHLPDGYRYTAFLVSETASSAQVAAAWEEARFTRVGKSGLYIGPVELPSP